jgi:hypothetical protein
MEKYSIRGIIVGLITFALNIYDVISTYTLIKNCGGEECSPIVSYIIATGGFLSLLIIKIMLGLAITYMFAKYWTKFKLARVGGYFVLFIYGVLTIYHTVNLLYC